MTLGFDIEAMVKLLISLELELVLQFLGAGERKKAIIGPIAVNVYAIGLYVDSAAAKVCGETVSS
jgi:hypothetical protein